jgi:hypothetical protein
MQPTAKKEAREALERATRERTAAQFVTFFGTLLGGLGGGLAAWLQRIFENPQSPLNVFRWCLIGHWRVSPLDWRAWRLLCFSIDARLESFKGRRE